VAPWLVAFGDRLRAYRLAAGLSQRGLGHKAGVSGCSVSDWERGAARPRPRSLRRLARALGVEPAELDPLRGEGA
jgi:transcriptional regulator with XRE-family HTH domain